MGKVEFDSRSSLREKFIFKLANTEPMNERDVEKLEETRLGPIKQFLQKIETFPTNFNNYTVDHSLRQLLRKQKEHDLLPLVDYLSKVYFYCWLSSNITVQGIDIVNSSPSHFNIEMSMSAILGEKFTNSVPTIHQKFLKKLKLKDLKWFSNLLVVKYLEHGNLFCEESDSISIPLQSDVKEELKGMFDRIVAGTTIKKHLDILQKIANLLMEKRDSIIKKKTEKSMQACFR